MLPAAHRLRTAADFRDVTRGGRKAGRGSVVVYLSTSDDDSPARAGLIVSKQVGGSVQRHRAARRMRGALAAELGRLPAGARVVVRALPGADRAPDLAADLRQSLDRLLGASA